MSVNNSLPQHFPRKQDPKIYYRHDPNRRDVTFLALVGSDGHERMWCVVDLARRKMLARQIGFTSVETLLRNGYKEMKS